MRYYPDLPRLITHPRLLPFVRQFSDREEAIGTALMGLIRAAHRFDPNRGIKFLTFSFFCIRTMLRQAINGGANVNLIRSVQKPVQRVPECDVWSQSPAYSGQDSADSFPSPDKSIPTLDPHKHKDLIDAISRLKPKQRHVIIECFLKGRPYSDVARDFGCTKQNIGLYVRSAIIALRNDAGLNQSMGRPHVQAGRQQAEPSD